jgi:hypothetical protein
MEGPTRDGGLNWIFAGAKPVLGNGAVRPRRSCAVRTPHSGPSATRIRRRPGRREPVARSDIGVHIPRRIAQRNFPMMSGIVPVRQLHACFCTNLCSWGLAGDGPAGRVFSAWGEAAAICQPASVRHKIRHRTTTRTIADRTQPLN